MPGLNALAVAVEAASRKRDDARKAQQAARSQLDQLEDYARETQARWGMKADTAVKPEVMFHHYHFMDRLGYAAGMQTGVVGEHASRVEAARSALLEAELRLASLKKVVEKRRLDLERAEMRSDQKQTDERAALQYRSATQGSGGPEY
jgi:flagellar FliJ protein